MGLDITYYRNARPVTPEAQAEIDAITDDDEKADAIYNRGYQRPWINPHFPGREAGINPNTIYEAERVEGFRAGSYSGYNRWRSQLSSLAAMVGGGAFAELINFSDCEGIIGPEVSAKLAADFVRHQGAVDKFAKGLDEYDREWFPKKYADWRKAFEVAAHGGFVDFH